METIVPRTQQLLDLLGHEEIPFGTHYSDVKPEGYGPKPGQIFSREREAASESTGIRLSAIFPVLSATSG